MSSVEVAELRAFLNDRFRTTDRRFESIDSRLEALESRLTRLETTTEAWFAALEERATRIENHIVELTKKLDGANAIGE